MILKKMKEITDANTEAYKTDLLYDKEALKKATQEKDKEEREFIWISRKCGTNLLKLCNVYCIGSSDNTTFLHHADSKGVRAFKITVNNLRDDDIEGKISEIDIKKLKNDVEKKAKKAKNVMVKFENGVVENFSAEKMSHNTLFEKVCVFGKVVSLRYY